MILHRSRVRSARNHHNGVVHCAVLLLKYPQPEQPAPGVDQWQHRYKLESLPFWLMIVSIAKRSFAGLAVANNQFTLTRAQ